jgi:hypothetical protein
MCGVWWRGYVEHYNNVRLNSAIGYITPKDMLARVCLDRRSETQIFVDPGAFISSNQTTALPPSQE